MVDTKQKVYLSDRGAPMDSGSFARVMQLAPGIFIVDGPGTIQSDFCHNLTRIKDLFSTGYNRRSVF